MVYFIYMISDYTHKNILVGCTTNLFAVVETNELLNKTSLHYPPENYLNRLVYFEETKLEYMASDRTKILSTLTTKEKREMITEVNPEWQDLTTYLNFVN